MLLQRFVSSSICKEKLVASNGTILVSNFAGTFIPEEVTRRCSVEMVWPETLLKRGSGAGGLL